MRRYDEAVAWNDDFAEYDENKALHLIREDKNGTRYYTDYRCPKCGGTGYISYYAHVQKGQCFKCGGSGEWEHGLKVVKESYKKKLDARRLEKARAVAAERNAEYFKKMGLASDGSFWVVMGDSFSIKEELKAKGAHFNHEIGWYFAEKVEGYDLEHVDLDTVRTVRGINCRALYQDADGTVRLSGDGEMYMLLSVLRTDYKATHDTSKYYGEPKQRITRTVKVKEIYAFETNYTYYGETSYLYLFEDSENHVFTWKTSVGFGVDLENGTEITIKGTIKEHKEYKGTRQTVLTRCKMV